MVQIKLIGYDGIRKMPIGLSRCS